MMKRRLILKSAVPNTYRVGRVAALLDRPTPTEVTNELEFAPPPDVAEKWSIGLIVGPSGSGKTTVARNYYPNALAPYFRWDDERPIVEGFEQRPFEGIADALYAVGFATPKRWLQPYSSLSAGERFRCDLAKKLLDFPSRVVAVDEFTSLVDRTVAKTSSVALRKAFDRGAFGDKKFVAISCHYDVAPWLEPDWTLDMATGELARGRLRRPRVRLRIYRAPKESWDAFKDYHYLSGKLNPFSRCYVAALDADFSDAEKDAPTQETSVAFAAIVQCEGWKGRKRVHRLVVRPEFQGMGIGGAFLDALGETVEAEGAALSIVTGAPQLTRRLARSSRWRLCRVYPCGKTQRRKGIPDLGSFGRAVVSFQYGRPLAKNEKSESKSGGTAREA